MLLCDTDEDDLCYDVSVRDELVPPAARVAGRSLFDHNLYEPFF